MNQQNLFAEKEESAVRRWHSSLDKNRGDRARLRRAELPEDILLTEAFFHFLQEMPEEWRHENRILATATIAGALSHVKMDKFGNSFAQQLATPIKGDKPPVSELRFQQLMKSKTLDDFYRRLVRTIRLLDGQVNIVSLANDITQWHRENTSQFDRSPSKRLAVRWATDYFTALPHH